LIVEKNLLLAKQTQVRAEKTRGASIKVTQKYMNKTKCCQQPMLPVCARPMPYGVREFQMCMK